MAEPHRKPRFLISFVLWGDWYVDVFVNLCLPALLAPRNLPKLREDYEIYVYIFTTNYNAKLIEGTGSFKRLAAMAPTIFKLKRTVSLRDKFRFHHIAWQFSFNAALEEGGVCAFLPPDLVWSDGSLEHVGRLFFQNMDVVYITGPRVTAERKHSFLHLNHGCAMMFSL